MSTKIFKIFCEKVLVFFHYNRLFNGNVFRTVAVCLDSGKIATAACHQDVRGINRVVNVNVYPGDEPEGTCDKHVQMEFCVSGYGVATEYCSQFPDAQMGVCSLVKLNDTEIQEIRDAASVGLADAHLMDAYVYYEGENGWHGFRGTALNSNNLPYVSCQIHTRDAWQNMAGSAPGSDLNGDGIADNGTVPGGNNGQPGNGDIVIG